jgi:hypothetical protein
LDGIRQLTDGIAWDQETFTTDTSNVRVDAAGRALRALPLIGKTTVLVWVRNAQHVWYQPDLSLVAGASLRLANLPVGHWSVVWMDPLSGTLLGSTTQVVANDELQLAIPDFRGEIALRLELGGG